MCYAVSALKVLMGDLVMKNYGSSLGKKAQLVYGRLLDVVFKLDHIDAEDTGKSYLNMQELGTDRRLSEKFDVMQVLWAEGPASPEAIQAKDWNSVLDAVQKDITHLVNDHKYKRLIRAIDEEYSGEPKVASDLDQIFYVDRFKNDASPWMVISKRI